MRQNRRFIKEVISFTHFCVLQCYLRIYNKEEINKTTKSNISLLLNQIPISYTKVNSKLIEDLNTRPKPIKLIMEI